MFNAIFYQPLYNALVFISSILPGGDIGLAIIILTILVKVVLFPFFQKATLTQMRMKKVEPELAKIKEIYKNDQQTQTIKTLELYRVNKINPFSSLVVLIIQIPIVIALFWVFRGNFVFDQAQLYSFVSVPHVVSTKLLGILDITQKSIILAVLTGLTQFIQTKLTMPAAPPKKDGVPSSFKDDFARSLNMNMRYFMPIFVGYIAYTLSSAIALYWVTSNLFAIGQEYYIRKKREV